MLKDLRCIGPTTIIDVSKGLECQLSLLCDGQGEDNMRVNVLKESCQKPSLTCLLSSVLQPGIDVLSVLPLTASSFASGFL